jgi:hypothetical protein
VAVETGTVKLVLLEDLAEELELITVAAEVELELLEKEITVEVLGLHLVMLLLEVAAVKVKSETLTEHLKVELILLLVVMVETVHKVILLAQQLTTQVEELEELTLLLTHLLLHKLKVVKVAVVTVMEIGLIKITVELKTELRILAEAVEDYIHVETLVKQEDQVFV